MSTPEAIFRYVDSSWQIGGSCQACADALAISSVGKREKQCSNKEIRDDMLKWRGSRGREAKVTFLRNGWRRFLKAQRPGQNSGVGSDSVETTAEDHCKVATNATGLQAYRPVERGLPALKPVARAMELVVI